MFEGSFTVREKHPGNTQETVRVRGIRGRTLSETKASRVDAMVPTFWYLVSSGGQATIRISEGLSLGLDDQGGLLLSPSEAERRWVRFEFDRDGVWLRVVSPAWCLASGERGLPERIKLDHLMGLQLPGHHFQVRSGLSVGDDTDVVEVTLIPQLAPKPSAEPMRRTTRSVPQESSVSLRATSGEVRSAAAAGAGQPTPVRSIITVPEVPAKPLPKAAPKASPEVSLEVLPEVSPEAPPNLSPVIQLPDTGKFVIVGERPVSQRSRHPRPDRQQDRETRPVTLLVLVLVAVVLLVVSRPAGHYGELLPADPAQALNIEAADGIYNPVAGSGMATRAVAGGGGGERPTLLLKNVEVLLSRKQPADVATLAFAVEAYRVASLRQVDDAELEKRYQDLSVQLAQMAQSSDPEKK